MQEIIQAKGTKIIRLGVLVDEAPENWVGECIRRTLEIANTVISHVVTISCPQRESVIDRFQRPLQWLQDPRRERSQGLFAPFKPSSEFDAAAAFTVLAQTQDSEWFLSETDRKSLLACDVDLWLCFTALPPRRSVLPLSRFGTWGLEIGIGVPAASRWAGALEVSRSSPITVIRLIDYAANDNVLYESFGATISTSSVLTRAQALRKGVVFPRRVLQELRRTDNRTDWNAAATLGIPENYPRDKSPTIADVVSIAASVTLRRVWNRIPTWHATPQWQVAYLFSDSSEPEYDFRKFRYLVPPLDRFWADPFAVEHDGRYFVFLEELPYSTQRGRLVAIEVFENQEHSEPIVILERPYHLSYPFTFLWEGTYYMIPETGENKTIEVYKCVRFPDMWELDRVLVENIHAFDATLFEEHGSWWMFANVSEPGADSNDELCLFKGPGPFGPFSPHAGNPLISDVRIARGAGPVFSHKGELFRPSQDCSVAYGYSVSINRIDALNDQNYREHVVKRLLPDWRRDVMRTHTFGSQGRLRVIDCMVRRPRW